MPKFTKEEADMLAQGLELYRAKLRAFLKQSETMKVAVDEIKMKFLTAEKLSGKITDLK